MDFGFIRVAAGVPVVKVADTIANTASICNVIDKAIQKQVSLLALPELCTSGYTCGDLFGQQRLIDGAEDAIISICSHLRGKNITVVVGAPVSCRGRLYNCAVVINNGEIRGIVPKIHMPTYNEFYESRWFASGQDFIGAPAKLHYAGCDTEIAVNRLFDIGKRGKSPLATFAIEICEDLWTPIPPSSFHALCGAQLLVNLSASNEVLCKHDYRKSLVAQQSARTVSGYIYASAGFGESTQDLVFAGSSMIAENGSIVAENQRFKREPSLIAADIDIQKLDCLRRKMSTFQAVTPDGRGSWHSCYTTIKAGSPASTDFEAELLRRVEAHPFVPHDNGKEMDARCREITSIQIEGLATRLAHIGCRTAVIGISGGLDSTLALIIAVLAADSLGWERNRIIGVTMPGYGTTGRTYSNAMGLMKALGVTIREISIVAASDLHLKDLGHDGKTHDVTYENTQARERTQILMDVANQEGGIVVGTGDLSELALGWATYNGDHMSMYGVNCSIPKTLVRHLVKWAAMNHFASGADKEILLDIVDTPVSPELIPADKDGNISQITEDLVGPYELHDFFLYNFFRFGYSPEKLLFLARKAFAGQFEDEVIKKWLSTFLRRFFNQQFKRSCLPDGPKVGSVSLSPRGDWRMPSDACSTIWSSKIK